MPRLSKQWEDLFEKVKKIQSDLRKPRASSLTFSFVEVRALVVGREEMF
jgi:hypothetical protein